MSVTRPILRYHGGKYRLAPWIVSHLPPHRIYVEPFGGAAGVLLRKPRSYAEVYNDLDGEVVNVFRVVRDHGEELRRRLELTPFARDEYSASFEQADEPIERARHSIVRAFMGFGSGSINRGLKSGFRANAHKNHTTPAMDWAGYPDALPALIGRLRGVIIENRAASEVMAQHDGPTTLHYLDPPYVHSTRQGFTDDGHGYAHEMTDEQHRGLRGSIGQLAGMVVVSGYHSPLYDELYAGWPRVEREALADGARKRTEVLWISPRASEAGLFERKD